MDISIKWTIFIVFIAQLVVQQSEACPTGEAWCSSLDETEKLALEAIHALHRQLDDDKNGNIDLAESDEFLREELKYEKNIENRQRAFHRNDDLQVSVRELWETWRKSEVHNWTVEQTVEWLSFFAGLPQHQEMFLSRGINGTVLPILAVNHNNYLQTTLGVKDSITRQRIALKAMDVVLFGPPRDTSNRIKDVILTTLLALAVIACYLVYKRYQWAQEDLSKMSKHMAELSKAEETLLDLQRELEKAKTAKQLKETEAVVQRDNNIEGDDPEELIKLREENMVLRNELHRAESELQDKCWLPPTALQHWLQYTYELELKTYNKKKTGAEKQLKQAKDACDKLKKKRSSLMGAFVTTHGRSIDDVDKAILEARTALTEITLELQERMHRWKQIELLVNFPIMNNPGMQYLENTLKVYGKPTSYGAGPGSVISNSQDDIDDDASSIYCPSAVHKLVSTSTYLMFPGHQNPSHYSASARVFNFQQSSCDYSSLANFAGYGVMGYDVQNRTCQSEISGREKVPPANYSSYCCRSCSCQNSSEMASISEEAVSGPTSQHLLSMARSKSVSSMLSLRDRGMSRESSSKDSSQGEEEVIGEASDITNSRRVTFRADHRSKMKAFSNGRSGPLFDSMDNEETRRVVSRALSQTTSMEYTKSKSEESAETEDRKGERNEETEVKGADEEPKLLKVEDKEATAVPKAAIELNKTVSNNSINTTTISLDKEKPYNNGVVNKSPMKERGAIWNAISKIVSNGKGDVVVKDKIIKSKSEIFKKDKSQPNELNGSNGLMKSPVNNSSSTKEKKSKPNRLSGIFSSLRRHSDKTTADA